MLGAVHQAQRRRRRAVKIQMCARETAMVMSARRRHVNQRHQGRSLASGLSCFRCGRFIPPYEAGANLICSCGGPLLQQYDLSQLTRQDRDALAARSWDMWRYRELLPVADATKICTLSEGGTPILNVDGTAASLDCPNLVVKDEGRNPTGSFKARGASAAVSRLHELGFTALAMPTVGSGGSAWSAYASRAGVGMLAWISTGLS
jgi:threonine synthase